MLLHSREGSGEHRLVDVNAIVEESLNLAWHGARAEKHGFNVTMERSFDPSAGKADIFPQDITRALLNLISMGFMPRRSAKRTRRAGITRQRSRHRPKASVTVWKSGSAIMASAFHLR